MTLSPNLPPRNLAALRELDVIDISSVSLTGHEKVGPGGIGRQPLPAEAFDEALALTAEMHRQFSAGLLDDAFKAGRQALVRWHALQAHQQSCDVLHVMAWACMEHEQGVEALALARHALRLSRVHAQPQALIKALSVLAVLHGRLHDPAVGEQLAMQALSRARDLHDRAILSLALDALLRVLLEAHDAQRAARDLETAQATAERLRRHANQGMVHSGPVPGSFDDMQLRIHAAAGLAASGRILDVVPALVDCVDRAKREGYLGAARWAQLFSAHALMLTGDIAAAAATGAELAPLLSADDPPRLRLACLRLQQRQAEHAGDSSAAQGLFERSGSLQETLLRQRFKLRDTLRRSGDDVMRVLSGLDERWGSSETTNPGPSA